MRKISDKISFSAKCIDTMNIFLPIFPKLRNGCWSDRMKLLLHLLNGSSVCSAQHEPVKRVDVVHGSMHVKWNLIIGMTKSD